jgi:hypothetical protein
LLPGISIFLILLVGLCFAFRFTSAKEMKVPLKLKFKARQLESAKHLIRLQSSVTTRVFKKGDVVYKEGKIGDSIYYVDENIGGKNNLVI